MKVIGVTGNFGAGKTLVASVFASLGARVCDADRIAHSVIGKNTIAYKKIVRAFGAGILNGRGNIDRKALGSVVFKDRSSLKKLNRIVHPEVIREIKKAVRQAGEDDCVVIDAPLLVEAGLMGIVDSLVVVKASRKAQIARCAKKFGVGKADVLRRIRCQMPQDEKAALADFIIYNNGKRSDTVRKTKKIWETLHGNS